MVWATVASLLVASRPACGAQAVAATTPAAATSAPARSQIFIRPSSTRTVVEGHHVGARKSSYAGTCEHVRVDHPDWFTNAIAVRPDDVTVDVDDARVHYRRWGEADHPGLVLVHGGAAHSGWWDHIAPLLSDEYCVVAPDLTGHGESDRRAGYDLGTWAREVVAVAADAR